jgi:type IV pilus assembly protein PilM
MRYGATMMEIAKTYPIGIDMDDRCLTAAQFHKSSRGIRLRGVLCKPLAAPDAGDDAAVIAALKSVISSGFFKGRRVVFNIPSRDLSAFPVHFPLSENDEPEESILREALKFLPYPLEEAVIDYPSLVRRAGNCDAFVVAVRRQVMDRWLGILSSAGLTAEVMEFSISSLLRLHRSFITNGGQADLICHIGRTNSLLAVVDGESILSFSEIPWGIEPLCEKIKANFDLSDAGAESVNLLKVYGLAYADRETIQKLPNGGGGQDDMNMYRVIFQIIAPAAAELVYECHKTISYLRSLPGHADFTTVYLYGLADQIFHLDRYLEKEVEIPAQCVDAFSKLGYADGENPPGITEGISPVPALGLAMREITWL